MIQKFVHNGSEGYGLEVPFFQNRNFINFFLALSNLETVFVFCDTQLDSCQGRKMQFSTLNLKDEFSSSIYLMIKMCIGLTNQLIV